MNSLLTKQSAVGTGEVKPLSPDERLLRKAVARCLKAQVAEVHGRLLGDVVNKGGEGSGNFGHEGRPGEVGGSGPGGGVDGVSSKAPEWDRLMKESVPVLDAVLNKHKMDSSGAFETANNALYATNGNLGFVKDKNTRQLVRDMDDAFSKAPELGQNTVLYRGVTETISAKESYVDRGFTMTSVDRKEALEYAALGDSAHTLFEISVPKGIRAIVNAKEEVVLPRDSQYTITGSKVEDGVHVVQMRWERIAQPGFVNKSLKAASPANAVPTSTAKWDAQVVKEIRPIWFGLFKKGGDRALKQIRKFPKHARKMVVFGRGEMAASVGVDVMVKGGPGSGNFGHEGRPGEVGGSGPGGGSGILLKPEDIQSISDLQRVANSGKLPPDSDSYQYFYHAFRNRSTADKVAEEGLKAGTSNGNVFLSKDEIRDLGAGYAVVRVPTGQAKESVDVVEQGLKYRQWTLSQVPASDIVSIVREIPYGTGGHGIRENDLARWAIDHQGEDASDLPVQYRGWFSIHNKKSLKASPSIVIPDWIEDPDVLDALEREMFRFAQGIDQTTADALRDELMDGMENGETISQLANRISDISDEWVEGWRSEMIARTETARAFTEGHIEAWKSTGVVSRVVWHAAGDACPFCLAMDGTVVELGENFVDQGDVAEATWRGQEIEMAEDYSDVKGPPLHPNCVVYEDTPITAFVGLKKIKDVKEGDLVLTHRGHFRKVIRTFLHSYTGKTVRLFFGGLLWVTLTEDHPVLVGGVWKVAKDIVVGDQAVVARDCGFVNTPVLGIARGQVESRAVYNLSVEEDESFIAKGIVVHNCRCVLVAELDEEKMFVQKGGPGSGNFGHEGRPGEVGGSGPGSGGPLTSPEKVTSISDLERIANSGKLPSDTASYQYFYHAFRSRSTPDAVAKEGLKAGTTGGSVFLSKDEIRDLGAGYAVVRVPVGQAKESVDVVEQGLTYRQWTVSDVPVSDIVSIVREVPYGSGGHGTRENDLARWAIDHQGEDASDLPKQYRGWFNVQNAKSLKATPSIVIPEFERTNTRGD